MARYLQDIAADDVRDAGIEGVVSWVVRRTTVGVVRPPRYDDEVELATWCSGSGAAWAERRTTMTVGGRVAVEASSLWAALDANAGRPVVLPPSFFDAYHGATPRRRVGARLVHDDAPRVPASTTAWALRAADFDLLDHVNNAVAWTAIEEWQAADPHRHIRAGEVEYRRPIDCARALDIVDGPPAADGTQALWLVHGTTAAVSARLRLVPPD